MLKNRKGFTLAELLIVVAIIGVLVAIAIPVFTSQLEKSREATDLANVRAAYAEVMADANPGNNKHQNQSAIKTEAGWLEWQRHCDNRWNNSFCFWLR